MKKHLDLGCGANPRNPYNAEDLFGIDILERHNSNLPNFSYKSANVILEKIPFDENYFDSISAYDFIEHIPRLIAIDGKITFPFIDLMNEVYRVLKPNGIFYAITPVYPKESVFMDPTHVNFLTKNSYKYFTSPYNSASMYGYVGNFNKIRNKVVKFSYEENNYGFVDKIFQKIFIEIYPRAKQHILWEFSAIK